MFEKQKRGRPRTRTPAEIEGIVDALIAECEGKEPAVQASILSDYNVQKRIGLGYKQLNKYLTGGPDGEFADYVEVMQKLVAFRNKLCVEGIAKGGQNTGWIFLSKQNLWGGFQDVQKVENNGKQSIEIKINGANGKPFQIGK